MSDMRDCLADRAFVSTEEGYIGVCPHDSQPGKAIPCLHSTAPEPLHSFSVNVLVLC